MLKAIHRYIETQRLVSFKELCLHFELAPEALEPMLELMLARGDIREAEQGSCKELCLDCESPRYFEIISHI